MNRDKLYKAQKLFFNPVRLYETFVFYTPWLGWPDRYYVKCAYHWRHHRRLDLDHPRTFNEKIQWLKLNVWHEDYPLLVDKVRVKEWVARRIGAEYVIPTFGVWKSAEEIDFDSLPEKFVLKCNHNSHKGLCICKDKRTFDRRKAVKKLRGALRENFSMQSKEPAYGKVPRLVFAEKLLENPAGDVTDYKFFCSKGRVECIMVCIDRNLPGGMRRIYLDREWQPFGVADEFPAPEHPLPRPDCLDKMIELAEILAKDLPFVRVDLYYEEGRIYFGEMTLHSGGGMDRFVDEESDLRMGELIDIPEQR